MTHSLAQLRRLAAQRTAAREKALEQGQALAKDIFDKQIALVNDPAKRITVDAGRRGGKTHVISRDLVKMAQQYPRGECLYASITKPHAVDLLWRELAVYLETSGIPHKLDNLRHVVEYDNGARTVFGGINSKDEREKARGFKWRKVYLDETGSLGPYLEYFVRDILEPTLLDYDGVLVLAGTPSPQAAGFYYDACHSPDWSHHHWTVLDNSRIPQWAGKPNWREIAAAYVAALKLKTPDAKFRREYMGEWVRDVDALLYGIDPARNVYHEFPHDIFDYVIGADTGYNDASALVVLGASRKTSQVYLIEEWSQPGVLIDALAGKIKATLVRYPQAQVVIDPANKQLVESMRILYNLPLQLADKAGKSAHIDILNSALHQGTMLFPRGSATFDQMSCLEWDDQHTREREGFPADLGDACFRANTPILTKRGQVRIDSVTTDDQVWTRNGWRHVLASFCSGERETFTLRAGSLSLVGTASHPILTANGWRPLSDLSADDIIYACNKERPSSLRVFDIIATRIRRFARIACTSWPTIATCIGRYGKALTGPSLQDASSTTLTVTLSTIQSPTWSYSPAASTCGTMRLSQTELPCPARQSWQLSPPRQHGIALQQDDNGMASMDATRGSIGQQLRMYASFVAKALRRVLGTLASVVPSASRSSDETAALMMLSDPASNAARPLCATSIQKGCFAPTRVLRVETTGCVEKVYNLTVEDTPEYVAGGMLVHNCLYAYTHAHQQNFFRMAKTPQQMSDKDRAIEEERLLIASVIAKIKPPGDPLDYETSFFDNEGEF